MAYQRINFKDQNVERPRTYEVNNNSDGSITLVDSFGLVEEIGTPINADTMNHLEDGIAAAGVRKYSSTESFNKGEWVVGEEKLFVSLIENNIGSALTDSSAWEEVKLGGASGFNLFDTKTSDHILEGDELNGWALQGTYVYKEAVAGVRFGYPSFYEKCLEQFQDGENVPIKISKITLPTFTANTTNGITVSDARGNTDAYILMNGVEVKEIGLWNTYWFNIDYGQDTVINSYTIQADRRGDAEYPSAWTLQGSNNGTTFDILDTQSEITFNSNESKTFIVTTNKAYKQYRLVFSGGVEASSNGELGKLSFDVSSAIIGKKNANRHFFYDIADKSLIDELYNNTGMAWAYGIDTENERIFLPRNDWFEQMTIDINEVGDYVLAGLPNITGNIEGNYVRSDGKTTEGAFTLKNASTTRQWHLGSSFETDIDGVTYFDASRSNPIYGNSDTVQPNAVKKLLYICVGNTQADTSWVNVVEQVEEGVKDIQIAEEEAIARLRASSNALNQTQISNCLLEVPQNIKLELTDGVLTLKAGSKVIVPNGVGVFDEVEITSNLGVASGVGQKLLFYNLDTNSITSVSLIQGVSGETDSLDGLTYHAWYDTINNLVKRFGDNASIYSQVSFPFAIATFTDSTHCTVDQIFNGFGYIGSTVWVDKGVKGLIPNGRNEDGALNNIEFTTSKVLTKTDSGTFNFAIMFNANSLDNYINYTFDAENNYNLNSNGNTIGRCVAGIFTRTNGVISNFQPKQAFRAVDYNEFAKLDELPHITETYSNGTSWYRIYSDGWCEQGGVSSGSSGRTLTFLLPFIDTNYSIQGAIISTSATGDNSIVFGSLTTSDLKIYSANATRWQASGYIR